MSSQGVALFRTSSSAMRAEAVLTRSGVPVRLIPTPRELSSDCGVALRFDWDEREKVAALLAEAHVETAGIHPAPKK